MNKSILETIHESAAGLHGAGVMEETTLREFDALCLPPVQPLTPCEIKAIRQRCKVSQPVFARYLNTSPSTVRQWERGVKRPRGTSLRLLDIVNRKGLEAIA